MRNSDAYRKKILHPIFLFFFIFFTATISSFSESPIASGEVLKYKVMAYGIQVAEIKVTTLRKLNFKKKPAVSVNASVEYKKFLDFSANFSSILIDNDSLYVLNSSRDIRILRRNFDSQRFDYDYDSNRCIAEFTEGEKPKRIDTMKLKTRTKIWDPLALFFYARSNANSKSIIVMPTHLMGNDFFTKLTFMGQKFKMNIDAVDYPIQTTYISGYADWDGIYQLTGNFNVWVSDDEQRIPILGTVESKLGVITVELIHWERLQWQPPKFVEEKQ